MSEHILEISEALAVYDNEVQGNKFPGLEFDEVVTVGLFLGEEFSLSSFEILDEFLSFVEDFTPSHEPYCICAETLSLSEDFPAPARVHLSAVNILHTPLVSPVDIYWVSLDVIHGPDLFFEECIETMYLYSMDMVANLFFDTLYDDFFMDLDPPYQTFVDVARIIKVSASDLFVMQCVSVPLYRLNNFCDEHLFAYCLPVRGFSHVVKSQFRPSDSVVFAHARTVETALVALAACGCGWRGQETISEGFVSYDTSVDEKYYEHILAESVAFVEDNNLLPVIYEVIKSGVGAFDKTNAALGVYVDLVESLAASFVAQLTYTVSEEFDDGFAMGSEALSNQLAKDIVLDTIEFLHDASPSLILMEALVDSLVQYSESGVES
jgi:hypothetical protein